jgi:hypothetical protein
MSTKWAALPHKHANEMRRERWAYFSSSSTRPDEAFYSRYDIYRQVLYGRMGELKGERERNKQGKRVENIL